MSLLAKPHVRLRVDHVTVEYNVPSLRLSTLKETVIQRLRGTLTNQTFRAVDDVSFEARDGECVAILGHNGCGKSTLLKVTAGIVEPVSGTVSAQGRLAPMIELGAGFDPELTGLENIHLCCTLLGLSRREIHDRLQAIVDFSELGEFIHAPVKTYSSGMYARLGFACSTSIDPDVLLVDEILSVGDENFQRKCLSRVSAIRDAGRTIVLVSHDLATIAKFADRCYVMDHGRVVFEGPPDEATRHYRNLMDRALLYGSEGAAQESAAHSPSRDERNSSNAIGAAQGSSEYAGRPGTGRARITKISIGEGKRGTSQAAKGEVVLHSGEPWTLSIAYTQFETTVLHALDHVPFNVGIALFAVDLRRVHGGNLVDFAKHGISVRTNAEDRQSTGRDFLVTFRFGPLPLTSGKYILDVGLYEIGTDKDKECSDYLSRAQVIEVYDEVNPDNKDREILNARLLLKEIDVKQF